jgi:hypothetical protein
MASSLDTRLVHVGEKVEEPQIVVAIRVGVEQVVGAVAVCADSVDDVVGIAGINRDAMWSLSLALRSVILLKRLAGPHFAPPTPVGEQPTNTPVFPLSLQSALRGY